jgi:formylglycine-generating enzyme required for sulfatase activity
MVVVPTGPFWRGANTKLDPRATSESFPGKVITLTRAFEIDRTEVSRASYRQWVDTGNGTMPHYPPSYAPDPPSDLPVSFVSWDQARDYCAWKGKRLPTEAEWEKAARGTDGRTYPWGNRSPEELPEPAALAIFLYATSPVPVDSLPAGASPYGALHMAGNVWEWVSDWYLQRYYDVAPSVDPKGPAESDLPASEEIHFHVYRGGGATDRPEFITTANRFAGNPFGQPVVFPNLGMRCARDMDDRVVTSPTPAGSNSDFGLPASPEVH